MFLKRNDHHEIRMLLSTLKRIGHDAPEGISIKCYNYETKNRATLGIEKINPGLVCEKEVHNGKGYLHDAKDDSPFNMGGMTYCGRCHFLVKVCKG